MNRKILALLILGVLGMFQQNIHAQTVDSSQYLYNIGIPDSLASNILQEKRDFWVQLPESYAPNRKLKYPVVFILDGGIHMRALQTVYNYYFGHHLPDIILVGISNRENRTRDLTISEISTRNGGPVNEASGGAELFTGFLEKELIPYIESKYNTSTYRTLIGWSYGGLFTINTLVNHPDLFANYIAIDPSLDWDDQKLLKEARVKLQHDNFRGKSLFVSLAGGQLHMFDEKINLNNVMKDTTEFTLFGRSIIEFCEFAAKQDQNELNFSYKYYPSDYHWTITLPSITDAMVEQFEWFQLKSPTKYNNPETSLDELMQLVREREKILNSNYGYKSPPLQEDLLNQTGYMYMQFEQFDKSYAFFKMYIDYYPNDANAHDSMADYYESQNDFSNALKSVTRAFEISQSDYHKSRMEELKNKI